MIKLLTRLAAAHHALNRKISAELARRMPDSLRLAALKRRRLAIKDRLHAARAVAHRIAVQA